MSARGSRTAAVARGLSAFAVLVALLFGLPTALAVYGSSLFPDHLKFSLSGIGHALTSPDNGGQLFMQALVVVGWLGWASFAISVLVEIPAQLRRRPTIRIRGLGWSQSAAATLITSITVMLAAPLAPLASAATPVHAQTVAATSAIAGAPAAAPASAAQDTTKTTPAVTTTYTVKEHDTLWGIAEKLLGAGDRYHEVAALNEGQVMTGGAVFHTDGFLQPGWVLRVPAHTAPASTATDAGQPHQPAAAVHEAAATTAPGSHANATGVHDTPENVHLVVRGDSLSAIAAKDYGNPDLWPTIFDANKGAEQAGGHFTNPDLIFPGDKLVIPHLPAAATPTPPADSSQAPSTPSGDSHSTAPTTAPSTPPAASPSQEQSAPAVAPSTPAASDPATAASSAQGDTPSSASSTAPASDAPTQSAPAPVPSSGTTAAATHAPGHAASSPSASQDIDEETGILLGGTLLTGVVVVGALRYRRRLQHKSRAPYGAIAMPSGRAAAFETSVRAGHDPDGAGVIAAALRLLAVDAADNNRDLPQLAAIIYRPGSHLELRLAAPASLPEPFLALDDSSAWWSCSPAALNPAGGRGSAYPALTALGTDAEGASVLIDLEMLGALVLVGPDIQTTSVLRRLLLDLAGSGFADHLSILLAGDAPQLIGGEIPGDRITVYPDVEEALVDLEHAARAAADLMEEAGVATMRQIRPSGQLPEAEPTYILVSNLALTEEQQGRLSAVLDTGAPAAAILTAPVGGHLAIPSWTLPVDAGAVHVDPIGISVLIPGLDDTTHELLTDLLTTASTTESAADPAWADMLDSALMASGGLPTGPAPVAVPRPAFGTGPSDLTFSQPWEASNSLLYAVPKLEPLHDDEDSDIVDVDNGAEACDDLDAPDGGGTAVAAAPPSGPRVLLLGPVEVTGRTGNDQRNRELRLTEMAAYMVLHPGGGHTALASALWPDSDNDRHSELSRLRTWLGKDDTGQWYLPHRSYSLENVTSDWEDFLAYVEAGNPAAALALVRDAPLLGTPPRRYGWAEWDRHMMIGKIADVALRVAEAALAAGDHEGAHSAAVTGLQAAPEEERLSRLLMRALLAARRRSEAADIAAAVLAQCDDLGVDPEPETLEVITQVRGVPNATAS